MIGLITGIIPYILILSIVVAIHEAGHCFAAWAFKLKIKEFSIGFGPALWESHSKKTTFKLRAIPLGGFIRVYDPQKSKELGADALTPYKKIIFYAAGPIANLLAAGLVILSLSAFDIIKSQPAIIAKTMPDTSASQSGLLPNDKVIAANGAMITSAIDLITVTAITPNNATIALTIVRDGKTDYFNVIKKDGKLGIQFLPVTEKQNFYSRLETGTIRFITLTYNMIGFPVAIVKSGQNLIDKMHGPVGIADLTGNVIIQTGSTLSLLLLGVQISIAMAVFNFLPLPVLDGGRIAFAIYEGLSGSRISPRMENVFNAISVYLIFLILIRVTTKDLSAYF